MHVLNRGTLNGIFIVIVLSAQGYSVDDWPPGELNESASTIMMLVPDNVWFGNTAGEISVTT